MDGSAGQPLVAQPVPEGSYPYPEHEAFGLQRAYHVLLRRRLLVLAVFCSITLGAVVVAASAPPAFEATALLMMNANAPLDDSAAAQTPQRPDDGYVESQVELLRSEALTVQLVDRLNLFEDSEFGQGAGERQRLQTAQEVGKVIDIDRRNGTYIVEVTVRAGDPVKAARIANGLVEVYFASRNQARAAQSAESGRFLDERLQEMARELRTREAAVEAFRVQHGLLTVQGSTLTEQQMRDAEGSVVVARADLAEREARYNQVQRMIQRGGSADTIATALNSEVMVQLRARQADVMRRLADYGERYGEQHPSVITALAERDDIERQIQSEVARLAQNLGNEAEISRARVNSLQGQLSAVRGQLIGNNSEQVQLRELERNAAAARVVYENFLLRYHEVTDGAGMGGDASVVSAATPTTEPVSRSLLLIALIAATLGLATGILAAYVAEQMTTTLQTAEEIERKFGSRILTSIPHLTRRDMADLPEAERHPAGFVAANPLSAFAEAIRVLRSRIVHAGRMDNVRVVAVTSALPGEGKSSIALCLARVAALAGRRVMLVDCDLRRRSLNHLLSIEPQVGILQVLRGEAAWREVAGRDEVSGAEVLPAAGESSTVEDVFGSAAMRDLIDNLSAAFDLVILDCPPVLTLAEVRDVATLADGVVVVARRGKTATLALQTALSELRVVNARVLGVAFNGVDRRAPGRVSYADPLYFSHAQKWLYAG